MNRKEFLRSLGAGAAFALTFSCLESCSKDPESTIDNGGGAASGVDFTVDLTASTSANLANNGGFIFTASNVSNGTKNIIVVKNLQGNYIAATKICSHEGISAIVFNSQGDGVYQCNEHGALFSQTGAPLNNVTNRSLAVFKTELSGDTLRIYS